jgi:hypothetical protein
MDTEREARALVKALQPNQTRDQKLDALFLYLRAIYGNPRLEAIVWRARELL